MKNRSMAVYPMVAWALTAGLAYAQTQVALPQSFTAYIDDINFAADGKMSVVRYRWVFDLANQRRRFDYYEVRNPGMPLALYSTNSTRQQRRVWPAGCTEYHHSGL